MDFDKLAYWTFNQWSFLHVIKCFEDTPYWQQKFDRDILAFHLSLDHSNRRRFLHYLSNQLKNYDL